MAGGSGLTPDVCRAQAEVLEHQGQKIKKIEGQIDTLINQLKTSWWGPDAKQFESKWQGQHKQDLTKVAKQLKTVAEDVRSNIKEQRGASH